MRFQFLLTVDWRVYLYTPNPQTNFHLCAWDSPYLPSEVVSRWQINKKYFFSPSYLAHRYTLLFCKLRVGSYMEKGFCPTVKSRNLQAIKKYQKNDWAITKNAGMCYIKKKVLYLLSTTNLSSSIVICYMYSVLGHFSRSHGFLWTHCTCTWTSNLKVKRVHCSWGIL